MSNVILVGTLTAPLASIPREIQQLPAAVTCLQLRADLAGDIPAARLRNYFSGEILYSLRSSRYGGDFEGSPLERERKILSAASGYDLVELEAGMDLSPALLDAIPPARRVISWRETDSTASLSAIFKTLTAVPAKFYCLRATALKPSEGLRPLQFLQELGRKDVVAFSEGAAGCWTQLLAPHFGSPLVFGNIHQRTSQPGEFTIQQLVQDYGFPEVRLLRELYGIAGNPILQSPSPRLHNAGYRALNYPAMFVPFPVDGFQDFWREMIESPALERLGIPIQGLTIVSPHKEAALAVADAHSPMVYRAGSTNIFVRRNQQWEAHTTDPESIAGVSGKYVSGSGCRTAVIGCGGAGRAVAAALHQAGAAVTLVNRGKERGRHAEELLGLPFVPLSEFQAHSFTLLVNATPIGRNDDSLPFAVDSLGSSAMVVDLAYGKHPTPLVTGVLARGGTVIDGHDVLLTQVRKQFRMMTGHDLPASVGRETVIPLTADEPQPVPGGAIPFSTGTGNGNEHIRRDRLFPLSTKAIKSAGGV